MSGVFVLALVMACGLAGSAFAAGECAVDADCPEGFSCQAAGGSACAVEIGPDGEPVTDPNCQPETYYACVPPPPPQCDPAQLSADCPSNQVCVTYTYEMCSGGGSTSSSGSDVPVCDPSSPDCPAPTPTECTATSESYCVPRYFAPCEASADCGPGFDCVEDVYEVCSGGTAPDTSSSGSEPLPPPDETTCETQSSGVNYCRLQEISCDNGQVCPEGLVCQTYDTPSTGTCSVDPAGNEVCTDPEPSTPVSVCVPEDWSGWFATAEDATGSGSSSGSIGENYNDAVGASTGHDGTVKGAEAALPDSSSSSGGTSGATSGGNTSGGSSGGNADGGGNSDDDGCQVSSTRGATSTPWAALGLGVGLLLAARGVRRRRA